jgi:replication factor A1
MSVFEMLTSRTLWTHAQRGRKPQNADSPKERKTLEYIARILIKYDIDPIKFLDCLMEAYKKGESEIEELNIQCRQKKSVSSIFLLTFRKEVIAQFPISIRILQRKKQLESLMKILSKRKSLIKIINPRIEDLRAGMKNVNLKAKVLDIPKPNLVYTRWGNQAYVSNLLINDGTGTMKISLWNEQINKISEGDTIEIRNGSVANYKGELQIRIARNGSIDVID